MPGTERPTSSRQCEWSEVQWCGLGGCLVDDWLLELVGQPVGGSRDSVPHFGEVLLQLLVVVDRHLVQYDMRAVEQQNLQRLGGAVDAAPQRTGRRRHVRLDNGDEQRRRDDKKGDSKDKIDGVRCAGTE